MYCGYHGDDRGLKRYELVLKQISSPVLPARCWLTGRKHAQTRSRPPPSIMPSSTTASQSELKTNRVPLHWRDSCSAYAALFTLGFQYAQLDNHCAGYSFLSTSVGRRTTFCPGNASMRNMRTRSALFSVPGWPLC